MEITTIWTKVAMREGGYVVALNFILGLNYFPLFKVL